MPAAVWTGMSSSPSALDPDTARKVIGSPPPNEGTCTMCGKMCAVRSMNKALAGEYIDIL